jgi:hypothetical protein
MYGNFDSEIKQQIVASIGREFKVTFPVARIHLLSCNGEPKEWYHVREFEIPDR